jgi:site-specific recombinase XerD
MYEQFLNEQRGLSETSIEGIKGYCVKFLKWIYDAGITKMNKMNRHTISRFIICEGQYYGRQTMIRYCSILRGFLSYLYACGKIRADYSAVVVTPKMYKHERCPRFLSKEEVEAMLSSVDRQTDVGRRNHAILMLLSTYGLRGIEVTRLRLDDIDWRAETIYIQMRKAGNHSTYPLTPSVGDVILAYIEKGRPKTRHRQLFLSCKAPYRPIGITAVRHAVKKHLRLAGFTPDRAGAHTFRYSCAQRLFEEDFSIKVIGDYLGHRNLGTTQRYVKIDLKHLRQVAINSGEELL